MFSSELIPIVETQVKERLTGAVILVTLFVLLVPELLTGGSGRPTPPPPEPTSVGAGEPAVRTYNIDLVQGGVRQEQTGVSEPDLTAKALKKEVAGDLDATVEPAKAAAEQVAAQPRPLASTTRRPGGDPAGKTPAPGLEPKAEKPVPSVVKAAPPAEPSRLAKVDEKSTLSALEKPAVQAAPERATRAAVAERAAATGTSAKGWAVQLGSFASRDNAQRLVKQLKGKGYSAFVLGGGGSSGKLFRVRVGPESDRAAAAALAAKLRSAGHKGSVVSQP